MEQETKPDNSAGWAESLTPTHIANPPTPAMSDNIIFALGKQWQVSADENRIKAQFELWVRKNARVSIHQADQEEGPEEADRMRSVFQADFGAGAYSWDGSHCVSARRGIPGLKYLLYLMLARCHNGKDAVQPVTEAMVHEMFVENSKGCLMAIAWSVGNFPSRLKRLAQAETNGQKSSETTTDSLDG